MVVLRDLVASSYDEASSNSVSGHKYDVFMSFRGKDTRKNFADHLYTALTQAGIDTFRDEAKLVKGENITRELHKAIRESKCAIIVFSKNYTSSEWCLDELRTIIERKKTAGLIVLPVFYDVQPSRVRKQTKNLKKSFPADKRKGGQMEAWKAALREVADLAGLVLQNEADGTYRYESKFIQEIVEDIKRKLNLNPSLRAWTFLRWGIIIVGSAVAVAVVLAGGCYYYFRRKRASSIVKIIIEKITSVFTGAAEEVDTSKEKETANKVVESGDVTRPIESGKNLSKVTWHLSFNYSEKETSITKLIAENKYTQHRVVFEKMMMKKKLFHGHREMNMLDDFSSYVLVPC